MYPSPNKFMHLEAKKTGGVIIRAGAIIRTNTVYLIFIKIKFPLIILLIGINLYFIASSHVLVIRERLQILDSCCKYFSRLISVTLYSQGVKILFNPFLSYFFGKILFCPIFLGNVLFHPIFWPFCL